MLAKCMYSVRELKRQGRMTKPEREAEGSGKIKAIAYCILLIALIITYRFKNSFKTRLIKSVTSDPR